MGPDGAGAGAAAARGTYLRRVARAPRQEDAIDVPVAERTIEHLDAVADRFEHAVPGVEREQALDVPVVHRTHVGAVAQQKRVFDVVRLVCRVWVPAPFEATQRAMVALARVQVRALAEGLPDTVGGEHGLAS